jgi:hypothetical protein
MTESQQEEVKLLLVKIKLKQKTHESEMGALRQQLLQYAQYFETYAEMYSFIKANTPTLGDFCKDMLEAMPIFWKRKDKS